MFYLRGNDRKRDLGLFNSLFNDSIMKTNIEETEKEYILQTELPGIKKEEVNINIDNDTLIIEVNKKEENDDKKYLVKERQSLMMKRSFYLENMNENEVKAKLNDGILTVSVTKLDTPLTKRIINIE
ncbi:MAG: Hsp20 family protein [Acholeplasmatales bacterium]|nr:Hsp20 family protein [Acholeplasmatales bacterium]